MIFWGRGHSFGFMKQFFGSRILVFSFLFILTSTPGFSQAGFGPGRAGEVAIAIVPMVGSGTYEDPRRPLIIPVQRLSGEESLDFRYVQSDDGRYAIVVLRAPSRALLDRALTSRGQPIKVFVRGKDSRAEVETEIRRYRRSFRLDDLGGEAREVQP